MTILEECIEALRAEGCEVYDEGLDKPHALVRITAPSGRQYPFGAWQFTLWAYDVHERTVHPCKAA